MCYILGKIRESGTSIIRLFYSSVLSIFLSIYFSLDFYFFEKALIAQYQKEVSSLKESLHSLEDKLAPREFKITLRTVGIAVRFIVRLKNMFNGTDFQEMGKLGFNLMSKGKQLEIRKLERMRYKLANDVAMLWENLRMAKEDSESARACIAQSEWELNQLRKEGEKLKSSLEYHKSKCRRLAQRGSAALHTGDDNEGDDDEDGPPSIVVVQSAGGGVSEEEVERRVRKKLCAQQKQQLRQANFAVQSQRHLSTHLARSLHMVRSIISTFDIESDAGELRSPFSYHYEAETPKIVAERDAAAAAAAASRTFTSATVTTSSRPSSATMVGKTLPLRTSRPSSASRPHQCDVDVQHIPEGQQG